MDADSNKRYLTKNRHWRLLSYIGHDGRMEFNVTPKKGIAKQKKRDLIILSCMSKQYFGELVKATGANPLLWTTGLMAPEAYTLSAALSGWISGESGKDIHERAAKAYAKYQKCSIKGARHLFATGF